MLVERLIHQRIGAEFIGARNVLERDGVKILRQCLNFFNEGLQMCHANLILPVELPDDELGIEVTNETIGVVMLRNLQPCNERPVLRNIVGFDADPLCVFTQRHTACRIFENTSHGSLAGIPARSAVGEQVERAANRLGLVHTQLFLGTLQFPGDEIRHKLLTFLYTRKDLLESTLEGGRNASHRTPV